MAILLDTNILLRLAERNSPQRPIAREAADVLLEQGQSLYITAQNVIEFWGAATRPYQNNGIGFTLEGAHQRVEEFRLLFNFLPDTPAVYEIWESLVRRFEVSGKQVHDTRLVAVMTAYGIREMLTFNTDDFRRFSPLDLRFTDPRTLIVHRE